MAKELTFSEATLGWRFAHTDIFLKHFIKQWELLQDAQIKNLEDYWNINEATGKWLNQIGELFDTARVETVSEDAFLLNVSRLNVPEEARLNGINEEVEDDLFRKLILVRSLSVNKLFSMKNIAETLYEVFGRDQIKVEFRENITSQGVAKDRYFQLLLTFKDGDMIRAFNGMRLLRPNLFLGKPMGVSYDIYVEYDPDLGTNTPQPQPTPEPQPEPDTPTEPDIPTTNGIGAVVVSRGTAFTSMERVFDGTLESISDYEQYLEPDQILYTALPIDDTTTFNLYADQQLTEIIGQFEPTGNVYGLYGNKWIQGKYLGSYRMLAIHEIS